MKCGSGSILLEDGAFHKKKSIGMMYLLVFQADQIRICGGLKIAILSSHTAVCRLPSVKRYMIDMFQKQENAVIATRDCPGRQRGVRNSDS